MLTILLTYRTIIISFIMSTETHPPLIVSLLGAEGYTNQIDRIRQGMVGLTYQGRPVERTDYLWTADLIYVNDCTKYKEVVNLKKDGELKDGAKVIFNVLDLPFHLLPTGYNPIKDYSPDIMGCCDATTTISPYVQTQLYQWFGYGSYVINNPIKDVTPLIRLSGAKPYPQFKAMCVGRLNDPNKRIHTLAIPALIAAGFQEDEVAMVGECPGWGTMMATVTDKVLNELYNSVDVVVSCGLCEGLSLTALESTVCGAIPIITSDLTTARDLGLPRTWECFPNAQSIFYRLKILKDNPDYRLALSNSAIDLGGWDNGPKKGLSLKYDKKTIAQNILNVYGELTK